MTAKQELEFDQLEVEILALRKFAESLVRRVRAARKVAPRRRQSAKKADGVAAMKARLLTGKLKPEEIRLT